MLRLSLIQIKRLEKQRDGLYKVCHTIGARISAMEMAVAHFDDFAGEEVASVKTDLSELSRKFSNDLQKVVPPSILPKTGIRVMDNIFKYFHAQCVIQKINFQITLLEPANKIPPIVTPDELCELTINLVDNAMKAIKNGDKPMRSINVHIGNLRGNFILSVMDSGEDFTPNILMKLGTERVTTSCDNEGSDSDGGGFGYMSIFETLATHKASITIYELPPSNEGLSKSVTISFDTQFEYFIKTGRPEAFTPGSTYKIIEV